MAIPPWPPPPLPIPFTPPPGLDPWWWYPDLGEYRDVNPPPPPESPAACIRNRSQSPPSDFVCRLCGGRKIAVKSIHKFPFCWRCCHKSMPQPGQTMRSAIHNARLPGMPGRLEVWCRRIDQFCEAVQYYCEVVDRDSLHITLQ